MKVEGGQTTGFVNKGDINRMITQVEGGRKDFFLKKKGEAPCVSHGPTMPVVRLLQTPVDPRPRFVTLFLSFSIANYCYIREHEAIFFSISRACLCVLNLGFPIVLPLVFYLMGVKLGSVLFD